MPADLAEAPAQAEHGTDDAPDLPPAAASSTPSVIGTTMVLKGELTLDEDLIVHGTIDGTVVNDGRNITVTTHALVKGKVQSSSADIAGTIEGDFDGGATILVKRTAKISGELCAENLRVESGTNLEKAVLTGRITLAEKGRR